MVPTSAASCKNHPRREAIGICVRCRTRVCSECVTKIDGINYCVSCLGTLAAEKGDRGAREDRRSSRVGAAVSAGAFLVVLWAMAMVLLEAVMPG